MYDERLLSHDTFIAHVKKQFMNQYITRFLECKLVLTFLSEDMFKGWAFDISSIVELRCLG